MTYRKDADFFWNPMQILLSTEPLMFDPIINVPTTDTVS